MQLSRVVSSASNYLHAHQAHYYQTVIPTEAGRRRFPSFVRERVGLRSGGISLRSPAQAKPTYLHLAARVFALISPEHHQPPLHYTAIK